MSEMEFDDEVMRILRDGLAGVGVHQDVEADDAPKTKAYCVFFGNDRLYGTPFSHGSIAGPQHGSVFHTFGIHVSATSPRIRNQIVAEIRRLLLGRRILDGSAIRETGDGAGYGDTDNTLRPTRYTYYLTFIVTLDLEA